jgi:signal transduction histidine kinase/CheY-like chemotaxis protein
MFETGLPGKWAPRWKDWAEDQRAQSVLLAVVCFVIGLANLKLGSLERGQPLSCLVPGVALAAFLLLGRDLWPGVLVGTLCANWAGGLAWPMVLCRAFGDTLGVVAGWWLLDRFGKFRRELGRVHDVLALFYFGALATAAVGASFELAGRALAHRLALSETLGSWWQAWLGDCLGVLTVTPFLLTGSFRPWRSLQRVQLKEAAALMGLLAATALLVFSGRSPALTAGYSVAYVVFAFSFWSALRFGPGGAAATVFLVGLLSAYGTVKGFGPFVADNVEGTILLWGVFNGLYAISTLILAAVMAERQGSEQALGTSEARYRRLFTHAPISIWEEDFSALVEWLDGLRRTGVKDLRRYLETHPEAVTRASGLVRVTDINDVTLKMFEAERREQMVGDLARLLRQETRPFFLEEVVAVWEGRLRFDSEVAGYTLRGRQIAYILDWDASTETGGPDWEHVIVAILDVTERQRLREEIRQAQKMEAVGRLAGGMAHDFNNLIMTIQGYSTLLMSDPATSTTQRDEAEQIKRAAERASSLTRQLLAFSRKQMMKPRVLALNAVVSEMNRMLRRLIGAHIKLENSLAPDLGWVKADPGQLEQVVVNLAINARDAMPKGGTLTLETANMQVNGQPIQTQTGPLAPRAYVALKVSDTGCGMSPAVQAHLFEPFFTTKGAELGTGLGLSTVYGIIKQSGGEIAVASTEGVGSTFTIYLPRVEKPGASDDGRRTVDLAPRGSETVLVVEDEDSVRELLCKCLRNHGYTVLEAASGHQALQIAERVGHMDLALSDIVMPGLDGLEVVGRLLQSRPGLKILFYSGYTDAASLRRDTWPRGAGFLAKPFAPGELLLKVRDTLDGTVSFHFPDSDTEPPPPHPEPPKP